MLEENFVNAPYTQYIKDNFDVIQINIRGDRDVEFDESTSVTEKELAKKEGGELHITKSLEIRVESASAFFESVNAENRYDSPRGVIKIDV